jgi:acetoin:2,6-dichlorophenolindophenol oxidoreductase subunit alpha
MSVWTVRDAAARAIAHARAGSGPAFLEALTYRFVGHSRSDPGKYRPDGELDQWKERDPLTVAADRLRPSLGDEALETIAADVQAELERIEVSALAAPFPEPRAYPEFKEAATS